MSWDVWPTCSELLGAETDTDPTAAGGGAVTAIAANPVRPPDDALIETEPAATAVTRPLDNTFNTVVSALDQVTVRPTRTSPCASNKVAVA